MSRLIIATTRLRSKGGASTSAFEPRTPSSSPAKCVNTIVRRGRSPLCFHARASSSSIAVPLALSSAPLQIVSSFSPSFASPHCPAPATPI